MQHYPQEAKYLVSSIGSRQPGKSEVVEFLKLPRTMDGFSLNWQGFHLESVVDKIFRINGGQN